MCDCEGRCGDEVKFGGGKSIREGMGQATDRPSSATLDLVITNALIVDWSGIYKVSHPHGFIDRLTDGLHNRLTLVLKMVSLSASGKLVTQM